MYCAWVNARPIVYSGTRFIGSAWWTDCHGGQAGHEAPPEADHGTVQNPAGAAISSSSTRYEVDGEQYLAGYAGGTNIPYGNSVGATGSTAVNAMAPTHLLVPAGTAVTFTNHPSNANTFDPRGECFFNDRCKPQVDRQGGGVPRCVFRWSSSP